MKPQLLIGAATSGSGKTTFTMGLLRALHKRGLRVQPFKCGPDYIDTQFHTLAADHESVNLDTWMASNTHVQHLYNKYGDGADVCVTEGVMGLFDGYQRMQGSSAEIARLLNIPVVLIVNARSTAYSVAPLIYGFKHFNPAVKIAGIVFNQVSSPSHFAYLREACVDAGVECLGYLPMTEGLKIPSRHLGLTLTAKRSMNTLIEQAAELVGKYVDLDKLLSICHRNFPCRYTLPYSSETGVESFTPSAKKMKIAIARDPAFNFIYRENIDRLSALGSITYFSPVYGSDLPDADLVYLPGGYPELFARQLHRRKKLMEALRTYAEEGGKILAECGGMMFLTRSLTARQGGTAYAMTGILPLDCTMVGARLHLGLPQGHEWQSLLFSIQKNMMAVMSHVATPSTIREGNPNILPDDLCSFCEEAMDTLMEQMEDNSSFILPGGTPVSAQLQFARTVARRAERRLWTLHKQDPLPEIILRFINRLSDLFFVMARYEMQQQNWTEEKWQSFAYKRKKKE